MAGGTEEDVIGWDSLDSFNDVASSWSICNDTPKARTFTLYLYTDANYGGDVDETVNLVVEPGDCVTRNHVKYNDAYSSFRLFSYP
jgi:hypothetical protein